MKKVAFVFIVLFSGCATKNEIIDENLTKPAEIRHTNSDNSSKISHPNLKNSSNFDPLYGYNVTMTYINDAFYAYLFLPLAAGYEIILCQIQFRAHLAIFFIIFYTLCAL